MVLRQIRLSTTCPLAVLACAFLLGLSGDVSAFVRSEDELMQAQVTEAKARAKDFKRHQERTAQIEANRDKGAEEIKAKRAREEELQEVARRNYVEQRGDRLKQDKAQLRMESEDEQRIAREADVMENVRLEYLKKRTSVRTALERDAFIDPAAEYDIHPLPTGKKSSGAQPPAHNPKHNPESFGENF